MWNSKKFRLNRFFAAFLAMIHGSATAAQALALNRSTT
jgi:hypothetical protein